MFDLLTGMCHVRLWHLIHISHISEKTFAFFGSTKLDSVAMDTDDVFIFFFLPFFLFVSMTTQWLLQEMLCISRHQERIHNVTISDGMLTQLKNMYYHSNICYLDNCNVPSICGHV